MIGGPFDDEMDVRAAPAVREAVRRSLADSRGNVMPSDRQASLTDQGHRLLCEALGAAGVELGAYEHRLVEWLPGNGLAYAAVFAGLIERAYAAGKAATS